MGEWGSTNLSRLTLIRGLCGGGGGCEGDVAAPKEAEGTKS